MNIKQKLATGAATIALLGSVMGNAAFAETKIVISGNGGGSNNTVKLENEDKTEIEQNNHSAVLTFVDSDASTGGNSASGNVGGDNSVKTGDATSKVNVTVHGNSNVATLPQDCGCPDEDTTVKIKGNGKWSDNYVKIENEKKKKVKQDNHSFVLTGVDSDAKTGHNEVDDNVGYHSDNKVKTGKAKSKVNVEVFQGSNTLN